MSHRAPHDYYCKVCNTGFDELQDPPESDASWKGETTDTVMQDYMASKRAHESHPDGWDHTASQQLVQTVKTNINALQQFPERGPFTACSVPFESNQIVQLAEAGIVEHVDTVRPKSTESGSRGKTKVWRLMPAARERIEYYATRSTPSILPCGSESFENLRDSEFIQCKTCNGRWTKDEIRDYQS